MDSRVCLTGASGWCLFGFSAPVCSFHYGFVTVSFKFACFLNDFSPCGFPGCYVLGYGLWSKNGICSHVAAIVANGEVNSKQDENETTEDVLFIFVSTVYFTFIFRLL